jgi:hypothetical protein
MKYLKMYKVFESRQEYLQLADDVVEIFRDFFDEFGYIVPDHVSKHPNMHDISLYNDGSSFHIEERYIFGVKCLRIRITDGSSSRSNYIKVGVYKDFSGLLNNKYSEYIQDCHQRMLDFLNPVTAFVGSLGVYTRDFDMVYFYENPVLKRFKGVDIYGSNIAVELDKLGLSLQSNSRHSNGFNVYTSDSKIKNMYYLFGHRYDGWFYYTSDDMTENSKADKVDEWIKSEWDKVCLKNNIKNYQKVRNYANPKVTVAEFMAILKNNQDNCI